MSPAEYVPEKKVKFAHNHILVFTTLDSAHLFSLSFDSVARDRSQLLPSRYIYLMETKDAILKTRNACGVNTTPLEVSPHFEQVRHWSSAFYRAAPSRKWMNL